MNKNSSMKKSVFLDTNIILSVLDTRSTSYLLLDIKDEYEYFYCTTVWREIEKKINLSKQSRPHKHTMKLLIKDFLCNIDAKLSDESKVSPLKPGSNIDNFIIKVAKLSECESICTYNHKDFIRDEDFKSSNLKLVLPINLLRESNLDNQKRFDLIFNMNYPLKEKWSVYCSFDLLGITSNLILLEDDRKNRILLTTNGMIEWQNNNKSMKISQQIFKPNKKIKLLITKKGRKILVYNLQDHSNPIIDITADFGTVKPEQIFLFHNLNQGKFYGHIMEISTFHESTNKKQDLEKILYYDTLEYRWGSIPI